MTVANRCWICGEAASQGGEHLIKRSVLKMFFGKPSARKPLYLFGANPRIPKYRAIGGAEGVQRISLQSIDSYLLKLPVICSQCNNQRTQPHDRAFDVFFCYLMQNLGSICTSSKLRRSRIYSVGCRSEAIFLQLYFAKILGCFIAHHFPDADLSTLSRSILEGTPCESLLVTVGKRSYLPQLMIFGPYDVPTLHTENGKITHAGMMLDLGPFTFELSISDGGPERLAYVDSWQPQRNRYFIVKDLQPYVDERTA